MLACVICPDPRCGFGAEFSDIRKAPDRCPICGRVLIWQCPHCEALLRTVSANCAVCGKDVRPQSAG